jgi:hypothetical protein
MHGMHRYTQINIYIYIYISIMSAEADREVGGGGGGLLKGSLALIQKTLKLTRTHKNSLRTH